jgi:hypothetical protein
MDARQWRMRLRRRLTDGDVGTEVKPEDINVEIARLVLVKAKHRHERNVGNHGSHTNGAVSPRASRFTRAVGPHQAARTRW